MHRLMNALGWLGLLLAGVIIVAIVAFIVVSALVTIWVAGGTVLIWMTTGEISPVWQRVPTLNKWIGFSCLFLTLLGYAWSVWDDLKWNIR